MMPPKRVLGFTLVELLICMALMVLVGGVLYLLQSSGISSVTKGTTRLTLQSEVRRKLEKLVSDLRCTKEVLEIAPDSIKIRKYSYLGEDGETGDACLVTVRYYLERKGSNAILMREESKGDPVEILSATHIEANIFNPYYEQFDQGYSEKPRFYPFDMKENDSDQRRRISFIRVRMNLRQNREFLTVLTAITLRTVHKAILQPRWNFR